MTIDREVARRSRPLRHLDHGGAGYFAPETASEIVAVTSGWSLTVTWYEPVVLIGPGS